MPRPVLHVVDAELTTAHEPVGLVTFIEVWPDQFVAHVLLEVRLVGQDLHTGSPGIWWIVEDDVGTKYSKRRWGWKFRDDWWSHEVAIGPAPPPEAGRLTVVQPLLGARADIDLRMWPEPT